MKLNKSLLIVDMQNDFCPGGALGVPEGDKIIPVINKYSRLFSSKKIPIFATRDWHPVRTKHFNAFGGVWPIHCIQNSKGADFCPGLKLPKETILLYKGMDPEKDSYSAFQAEDAGGVVFGQFLSRLRINEIYIAGLATDYCVKFTAIDALKKGLRVNILIDAIKGVNLKPDDSERAIKQIIKLGARKLTIEKLGLRNKGK